MTKSVAILITVCALSFAFSGCGKKPAAEENAGTPPAAPANTDSAAAPAPPADPAPQTIAPPSTPTARPVTPTVIPQAASPDAVLAALTQAVRKYSAEKQRVPSSLSEVVGAGYIQTLPQPPAGKKFVIDAKTVSVVLQ